MKKRIKLCITMALRDYAAFEDLTTELGIAISDINIVNEDVKSAPRPKPQKRKAGSRRVVRMSPEIWDRIQKFKHDYDLPKDLTYIEVHRRLGCEFGKNDVPSPETVRRVVIGLKSRPVGALI